MAARKLAHSGCMCILQCTFESCCVQTGMRLVSEHNHIYCQCRFCYQWEGVKKWYGKLGTKGKIKIIGCMHSFQQFRQNVKVTQLQYICTGKPLTFNAKALSSMSRMQFLTFLLQCWKCTMTLQLIFSKQSFHVMFSFCIPHRL